MFGWKTILKVVTLGLHNIKGVTLHDEIEPSSVLFWLYRSTWAWPLEPSPTCMLQSAEPPSQGSIAMAPSSEGFRGGLGRQANFNSSLGSKSSIELSSTTPSQDCYCLVLHRWPCGEI